MPIDERTKEILESLVARIDMDDYVARVEAGIRDMPEYQSFVDGRSELDDRGRAGIRWNLEIFHRWARDGRPLPREDRERLRDLVGARAAEGRRPEEGLAVYRRAMRAGWELMLESADQQERAALGGAFDLLLEWIDVVSRVFEAARVLQSSGEPLDGLYAAGELAGFGGGGMHGYRALEGTFLGGCLFSGRTAGRAAAAAVS